ncbi:hypothetical protein [Roseococcus sp.]|uniref:hypothetical protein n=1 Tax=Roseococcus sp. TaxID=2109646 RepID=UPI003BABBEF1
MTTDVPNMFRAKKGFKMPAQAKSRPRPIDDAMRRLLDLAARAAAPGRMAREVGVIITEWRAIEEADVVRERIAEMLEQLDTGVIDAEEQVADADRDQPAAMTQANATLAAITACRNAARYAAAG